ESNTAGRPRGAEVERRPPPCAVGLPLPLGRRAQVPDQAGRVVRAARDQQPPVRAERQRLHPVAVAREPAALLPALPLPQPDHPVASRRSGTSACHIAYWVPNPAHPLAR